MSIIVGIIILGVFVVIHGSEYSIFAKHVIIGRPAFNIILIFAAALIVTGVMGAGPAAAEILDESCTVVDTSDGPDEPIEKKVNEISKISLWPAAGENMVATLTVMTYNVAKYNKDTNILMPADKINNFRELLTKYDCDVILLQEHGLYVGDYLDSNSVLYMPQYPYDCGYGVRGPNIKTKLILSNCGNVKYSDGRAAIKYGTISIGSKVILCASTHNTIVRDPFGNYSPSDSVLARNQEYQELIKWVSGSIALLNQAGNPVTVPAHDYVIIGMDANSREIQDKENLINACKYADAAHKYIPANGSFFGWFITHPYNNTTAIDNIIVSNNIIINSAEALTDQYEILYSDHVPVVASITLLE